MEMFRPAGCALSNRRLLRNSSWMVELVKRTIIAPALSRAYYPVNPHGFMESWIGPGSAYGRPARRLCLLVEFRRTLPWREGGGEAEPGEGRPIDSV